MKAARRRICASLAAAFASSIVSVCPTQAAEPAHDPRTDVSYCIARAAYDFKIPSIVILLIRDVEAGWVGAAQKNTDGSIDYGPMQVNSSWLPTLARFGITQRMLQYHACVNVYAGTWILANEVATAPNLVTAIADYHSHTRIHQIEYLNLVRGKLIERLGQLQKMEASR